MIDKKDRKMHEETYTNGDLLQEMERVANLVKKGPHNLVRTDMDDFGDIASRTYSRRFGGWTKAKRAFAIYWEKRLTHFIDKKSRNIDIDEILDLCENNQSVINKSKLGQNEARIRIKSDEPIIIVFAACFHLGSLFTDYPSLRSALKFMLDTPKLFMGLCGDMIDQFMFNFRDKSVVYQQVLTPEHQALLLQKMLQEWDKKDKLLFKVFGNHERYLERVAGTSLEIILTNKERSPFMPNGGLITLDINKQTYTLFVKHKVRFKSSVNPLHQPAQVARFIQKADIIVTSHEHNPAIGNIFIRGERVFLVRTGSYKIDDSFSMRMFSPGVIGLPSIVLFPDEHKIVAFDDPSDAVLFRDGWKRSRK